MAKDMTREVLIIGRDFHPDGKETAAQIAESLTPYLRADDISVRCVLLKDIVFDIANDNITVFDAVSGRDLASFQAVLMTNWFSHASVRKDMAYALAQYFESRSVPFFNTEALHSRSTSKLSQMMLAALHDVAIPRTVFSLSLKHTMEYMRNCSFPTPFVFKDAQASRGKGNYLLASIDEIKAHAAEHSETHPFMAQPLVLSDGSDYRYFVTGGEARLVIRRIGSGESHLNNTSAGATTEIVPAESFKAATLETVSRMSMLLHREVTGIDIMLDKNTGEAYFLEANPIPQIATGSNVALKLQATADALREAVEIGNQL